MPEATTSNPDPQCVIDGCENTAQHTVDGAFPGEETPSLCKDCHNRERQNWEKPRKCNCCNRRKQCFRDTTGALECRSCFHKRRGRELDDRRRTHTHAVQKLEIHFERDGTPALTNVTTYCQWQTRAEMDLSEGQAVYLMNLPEKVLAVHDPDDATCDQCRRSGNRELTRRQQIVQQGRTWSPGR